MYTMYNDQLRVVTGILVPSERGHLLLWGRFRILRVTHFEVLRNGYHLRLCRSAEHVKVISFYPVVGTSEPMNILSPSPIPRLW